MRVDKDLREMLIKKDAPKPKLIGLRIWRKAIPQFNVGHQDLLEVVPPSTSFLSFPHGPFCPYPATQHLQFEFDPSSSIFRSVKHLRLSSIPLERGKVDTGSKASGVNGSIKAKCQDFNSMS